MRTHLQRKPRRIPQLVAELAVGHHAVNVEIDVAALRRVRQQAETERVGAALGNALGEIELLMGGAGGMDRWVDWIENKKKWEEVGK